jgi:hypothetical protein
MHASKKLAKAIFFAMLLSVLPASTHAQESNVYQITCGDFRYTIHRVLDGFQIAVQDGSRIRTIFYTDIFGSTIETRAVAHVVQGCVGDRMAIHSVSYPGRYSQDNAIELIDPSGPSLRIQHVGTNTTVSYRISPAPSYSGPPPNTQLMDLLNRPTVDWSLDRVTVVQKNQISPEKADFLNDNRYAVFDARAGIVFKRANSNWNTVVARDALVCDGISYVLYEKQFADAINSPTEYPAVQYVIEKSGIGGHRLIPIPWKDHSWRYSLAPPQLLRCNGTRASMFVDSEESSGEFPRILVFSGDEAFIDMRDTRHAINADGSDYFNEYGFFRTAKIQYTPTGVEGTTTVMQLLNDGRVIERRPVFFRDIRVYPIGTSMEFTLDPRNPSQTMVIVHTSSVTEDDLPTTSFYVEQQGSYVQVDRSRLEWRHVRESYKDVTSLYVTPQQGKMVVKSWFLKESAVLHDFGRASVHQRWQRIGPLELDGTRKIWYGVTVNGQVQTWKVVVQ